MSWVADQFGMLFSVNDRCEEIELQRQKIAQLELTISDQLRSINSLTGTNLQLRHQIRKLETDCRMALNAMQHALGEEEPRHTEPQPTEGQDNEQRPDGPE